MLISPAQAISLLQKDGIVAIPTETVYGLAAAINSEIAIKRIFDIKKRPFFDPLIVHVENLNQAKTLVSEWPEIAEILAQHFWPGPLTLVLKKSHKISDLITAGLERVGIRCPNHPVALEILRKIKSPLAAPSANLFGQTSPTNSQHVEKEFSSQVPVVDGGSSEVGIESTVLLIDGSEIGILRSGKILASDIEKCLQSKTVQFFWKKNISKKESPGHLKHHYMPSKPLFWVNNQKISDLMIKLNEKIKELPHDIEGIQLLIPQQINSFKELVLPPLPGEAARLLYAELRRLSESDCDCLVFYFKDYMNTPEWEPILERLRKASSVLIKS